MFLKEHEGEALFRKYNIPVARGVLVNAENFREILDDFLRAASDCVEFVVKAQVLSGKRGLGGGVLFVKRDALLGSVEGFFGKEINGEKVKEIIVQEKLEIAEELYFGITIDRYSRKCLLIFSGKGGMEIEEIAKETPDEIVEIPCEEDGSFDYSKLQEKLRPGLSQIAKDLHVLFVGEDATLAEINPLVLTTDGSLIAADSKIIIDDNALYKHLELEKNIGRDTSDLEAEASENGLAYVELGGDIAVIGNGAGLVMASLDTVSEYGGMPANFCDIGGGATSDMMEKAVSIVLRKESVKALFINIFGGITQCDEVAAGILAFKGNIKVPIVVRMVGTNFEKGHAMLKDAGMDAYESFEEAVKKVVTY